VKFASLVSGGQESRPRRERRIRERRAGLSSTKRGDAERLGYEIAVTSAEVTPS